MLRNFQNLWNDEFGFIVSAELVLVLTIGVLMMVVGLHAVSKAIVQELNDLSSAFGAINQSYSYDGFEKPSHSRVSGAGFQDNEDDCDCAEIVQTEPDLKVDNGSGIPEGGDRY